MFSVLLILLFGVVMLYFGAEWLVRGSSQLALSMGIKPLIVGLTVVAMGTSSPEMMVSVIAAVNHTKDIALGNIIGSNIANLALVIGLSALIRPLPIQQNTAKKQMPFLLLASLLFYLLSLDGILDRRDGFVLFLGFVLFIALMLRKIARDRSTDKLLASEVKIPKTDKSRRWMHIGLTVAGLLVLVLGSTLIVRSATTIAAALGVSEILIGVTMVAVGTSLPELAISTIGALRGETDIAVGNAVGSNIFNTLCVLGIVALILPIPVETAILTFHFPVMLGVTLLFWPICWVGLKINRAEGVLLLLLYAVFIYFLFNSGIGI